MPQSLPSLQRLRRRARVKPGQFAEMVGASRSHYSNVEYGRKVGSPELFESCAAVLSDLLGEPISAEDLMAAKDPDDDEHEHTDAGTGPPNRNDSTGPGRHNPGMRAAS